MNNLDYYTVMEAKIKYFSQKYDPQNKLESASCNRASKILNDKPKRLIRKKIRVGLDSVISFFL